MRKNKTEYVIAQNFNRHRCEFTCEKVAEYLRVTKSGSYILGAKWCCESHKNKQLKVLDI